MSWLLWIVLLQTKRCMCLFEVLSCLDTCPGVGLPNHVAVLFLVSRKTSIVFPIVVAPIYIPPTSSVGEGDGTPLQYSCRKSPWTEEPGRLQSMGSPRVGHDWATSLYFSLSRIGEGNGNPLQCSCLENPRDRGAWWAAVYRVAQSRTLLKRHSSIAGLEITVILVQDLSFALNYCGQGCGDPRGVNLSQFIVIQAVSSQINNVFQFPGYMF